ncbi:DEAD-domain-containing protein [Rozella allomycis CSF55]|uniref:ATP-dependent RNA helicase n=1 Tax=Rozella allomycis (strain CSF55) TaxID=988480 RepID=A0A075AYG9_ROZAC|nr:DNA/RNA helicase, DEAD/DEAH box type domain-containing protein [Rozella allomycis CSF55]RKP21140.1 DEAD-domain-containing protein [Rozella allomycis CSF55]|eukprot:EPZ35154.1 DNA/RNA helicase, DEAD/DEAH box type domain-containing protein [Rozella allomycis CSF55]
MKINTAESFDTIDLSETTRKTLNALNFTRMTPVQAVTLPNFLSNKDVVVQSKTGSGKTLSFVIPVIEICQGLKSFMLNDVLAVIISPTRELAKQTYDVTVKFSENTNLVVQCLIGGVDIQADVKKVREFGGNILVTTPGRLWDIMEKCSDFLLFKKLEVLVFDEADKLIQMGFQSKVTEIIGKLPKQRRTGLFSATLNDSIKELIKVGLRNPVKINVTDSHSDGQTPETLQLFYSVVNPKEKLFQLASFLKEKKGSKIMVYFGTCACVEYFHHLLSEWSETKDLNLISLHGKMVTKKRDGLYKKFVKEKDAILLCTDVTARGIHVDDIDFVIQVGRSGRMGNLGNALVYLYPNEVPYLDFLKLRKISMEDLPLFNHTLCSSGIYDLLANHDRSLYEKSMRAFVSYVRFYQEHHASFIFRFKDIAIGDIADGFFLLNLPRMPELDQKNIDWKPPRPEVNVHEIAFKDPQREQQRLVRVEKQKEKKAEEKKQRKKSLKNKKKSGITKGHRFTVNDWDELQSEARLLKKLKKGKISEKEVDDALMNFE